MSGKLPNHLVYASDGSHRLLCKKCKAYPCRCNRKEPFEPSKTTLKIRLEKNGRGGKIATIVHELPRDGEYFKKLLKKIKSQCGTGGAYKDDEMVIQGDHREKIKTFLEKMDFKVKFSGGYWKVSPKYIKE